MGFRRFIESLNLFFRKSKVDILNFCVALGLLFYSLFFRNGYNDIPVINLSEVISKKPTIERFGGDFEYFNINISLVGKKQSYSIRWCSYDALDLDKLKLLNVGDKVYLKVKSDSPTQIIGFRYKEVQIIDEKLFESCYRNGLNKNWFLFLIALIFFLFSFFRIFRKKYLRK